MFRETRRNLYYAANEYPTKIRLAKELVSARVHTTAKLFLELLS